MAEPKDPSEPWLTVVLERKGVADLLNSANDERLANFTTTPSDERLIRGVLLHGNATHDRQFGRARVEPAGIDNLLVSIQMQGIYVLRADGGLRPLADRLASFWKWTGKDDHGSFLRPGVPKPTRTYFTRGERAAISNLMTLPGVGEERARDLFKTLGSLRAVYEALLSGDIKDMLNVDGIGKGTVDSARRFLG